MHEIADIYVRLSEQDRDKKNKYDDSESIQNQKTMLIKYCLDKGWSINRIYSDEDYSGADSSRPEWNALLKDCQTGKCTVVVCKTQSRFSRDMEMIERYLHGKFTEWGVRFVGVVDNADTSVRGNKKARQINGLVNEWYLEDLSDNIRSTLSAKRKNGQFVGSFAPYGYLIDPDNKNHLIVDEVAASVVRRIFGMYLCGSGYIHIAKALNADKIPPPCMRKKQLSSRYYNANFESSAAPHPVWSASAVYAVLRRQEYTGALVQGRAETVSYKSSKRRKKPHSEWDIVESTHQAIITKEQFFAAQQLRLSRGKGQKIPDGACHPLAKKVFCSVCGNSMWKMSYKLTDGRYSYLACKSRKTADGICSNRHSVRLDDLEQLVLNEINQLIQDNYDKKMIGALKLPKRSTAETSTALVELKELEQLISRYDAQLAQMYQDRLDGLITAEQFAHYSQHIRPQIEQARARIAFLKSRHAYPADNDTVDIDGILNGYKRLDRLSFFTVEQFIASVHIGALDQQQRSVKIVWRL